MEEIKEEKVITKDKLHEATQLLLKYKQGKEKLEKKIIANEQWWRLRHGDSGEKKETSSAWLFNTIISKHADAMDSFPSANILPRELDDREEATILSSIIPVILEQNDFEEVYDDVSWYKLRQGTGVYSVVWDSSKLNGLGDVAINKVDLLNLFWEPGITDIQKSRNLFHVELVDNDILEQNYPQAQGRLQGQGITIAEYLHDDTIDTTNKSVVIDWYYHTYNEGKKVLQYCKYVNDVVLYATEDDTEVPTETQVLPNGEIVEVQTGEPMCVRGWYDHGLYPFEFDVLFPMETSPCGFGYVDICKGAQETIDKLDKALVKNALVGAQPRFFIREDGSVNEEEFADFGRSFVHTNGNLGEDAIREIKVSALPGNYITILNNKIEELKETSGNRDVNNGGTSHGVTAYSAIVAMQEQSGKTSRDSTNSSYRTFSRIVYMVIELIRQFYSAPRQFRITGRDGSEEFTTYSNEGLQPQQMEAQGIDLGLRLPIFDIKVVPQKASKYTQLSNNELQIQMFQLGFFNPQMADQALACIQGMEFDNKQEVIEKIQTNQTLEGKVMALQEMVVQLASQLDPMLANQFAMQFANEMGMPLPQNNEALASITEDKDVGKSKLSQTLGEKAEGTAQEAVAPR